MELVYNAFCKLIREKNNISIVKPYNKKQPLLIPIQQVTAYDGDVCLMRNIQYLLNERMFNQQPTWPIFLDFFSLRIIYEHLLVRTEEWSASFFSTAADNPEHSVGSVRSSATSDSLRSDLVEFVAEYIDMLEAVYLNIESGIAMSSLSSDVLAIKANFIEDKDIYFLKYGKVRIQAVIAQFDNCARNANKQTIEQTIDVLTELPFVMYPEFC